jgi:hypothetical protein
MAGGKLPLYEVYVRVDNRVSHHFVGTRQVGRDPRGSGCLELTISAGSDKFHKQGKTMKLLIFVLSLTSIMVLGCGQDENECRSFSAANGDFEPCQWLLEDADKLCEWKGYSLSFGDITIDTVDCNDSTKVYIKALTCCK